MQKLPAIFIVLLFASVSVAQTSLYTSYTSASTEGTVHSKKDILLWATIGAGAVGPGIGALLKVTSVWGNHSISAKVQGGGELNLVHSSSSKAVTEYGLYYGRQEISEYSIFRGAAGPALFVHSSPNFTHLGDRYRIRSMAKVGPVGISSMLSHGGTGGLIRKLTDQSQPREIILSLSLALRTISHLKPTE